MITEYHHRERSLFASLDPRTLLVAATGAAFVFSFIQNLTPAFLCLAFSLVLAATRGFSALHLLKRLAVVNIFIAFIWLTVPLTIPGECIVSVGSLAWSREGVQLALLVTVKCNAILLSFFALVSGMSLPRIGYALERMHVPDKLVFLFLFTCRYIHVVGEEWQRLQVAAKLRGFVPRSTLHTYRTIGNMFGLTFINAVDRSRRIYEAMVIRGFTGEFNTVTELKSTTADYRFAILFFVALGGLLFFDLRLR